MTAQVHTNSMNHIIEIIDHYVIPIELGIVSVILEPHNMNVILQVEVLIVVFNQPGVPH